MEGFNFDDSFKISDLISRYLNGTLNTVDSKALADWIIADQTNRELFDTIVDENQLETAHIEFKAFDVKSALAETKQRLVSGNRDYSKSYKKWLLPIAASILLFLSIGSYLFFQHNIKVEIELSKARNIAPGKNQATLTLANGQKIILTKGLQGTLAKQGNTLINVNPGNAIAFTNGPGKSGDTTTGYNTLATKKGEQSPYPLILADGTKVWLNAASSITFPTTFTGKNRIVTITGEAYVEVVHNKEHPFNVKVKGQTIEDIGTSFNINAYDDEPIAKTTLIAGKISITKGSQNIFLKPGEQAESGNQGGIKVNDSPDIEEVLAWKNGIFKFNHADIKAVMRQLSRWYNVDVAYEGVIPAERISGKIYKNVSASNALEILNSLKINFRIEESRGTKKIIITP
jgi:hypothetical protein